MCPNLAQTLSDDLLYLILRHTLTAERPGSPAAPFDIYRVSPMNFSLVCRSWRGVAMAQGSLWSTLNIRFITQEPLDLSLLRMVQIWLRNSSNALLDIFCSGSIHHGEEDTVFESIFNMLLGQQRRWGVVFLNVRYPRMGNEHITISAASLTSLILDLDSGNARRTFDITGCLQLKKLVIRSAVKLTIHDSLSPRLHQLKFLRFSVVTDSDFPILHKVLLASPNLSVLRVSVEIISTRVSGNSTYPRPVFPHQSYDRRLVRQSLRVESHRMAQLSKFNPLQCRLRGHNYAGTVAGLRELPFSLTGPSPFFGTGLRYACSIPSRTPTAPAEDSASTQQFREAEFDRPRCGQPAY